MGDKPTTRDIYRNSCDLVGQALSLFGQPRSDGGYDVPTDAEHNRIVQLIQAVTQAQRLEEQNAYRTTILAICEWLQAALHKSYILRQNNQGFPSVVYVVHKGHEVLHCLLHRDLRRRALSTTESQLVQEFVALASNYPNPCAAVAAQDQGAAKKIS